jgi:hypothetical protein
MSGGADGSAIKYACNGNLVALSLQYSVLLNLFQHLECGGRLFRDWNRRGGQGRHETPFADKASGQSLRGSVDAETSSA